MAVGLIQCVFVGCLAIFNVEIKRRPYHRNCHCALHGSSGRASKVCMHEEKISYPIRRDRCMSGSLNLALSTRPMYVSGDRREN
ncbi:hypothetical protein QJS10_CPB17g00256 [Acorus calamus]|uniref:Secreted protein n=1 Tax=Acorus calamus TaxID=4465 RepID=A0AAV9CSU0_ACOCL|nr:hypothetical protein QJS10_CPB17g00256 [Acorus calamus]